MQPTTERSPEETAEIERHKYLLSEQAGHDVGWEHAEQDWEANHAEQYRVTMSKMSEANVPSDGLVSALKRLFTGKE